MTQLRYAKPYPVANGFPIPRGTINFIRDRGILSRFLSRTANRHSVLSRTRFRFLIEIPIPYTGTHYLYPIWISHVDNGVGRRPRADRRDRGPRRGKVTGENATKRALRCAVLGIFIEEYLPARSKSNVHAEWLCRL